MSGLFGVDRKNVFAPSVPTAEIVLRGSLIYLVLFPLMRFVLKREGGTIGLPDLPMVVLVADAAQSAMPRDYQSVTDGLTLVSTIVFWNYALDWLGHRFPRFGRLVHPPPLALVKDGQMLRRHLRRELITEDELISHLRQQGVEDLADVKTACLEGAGRISVITRDAQARGKGNARLRKCKGDSMLTPMRTARTWGG